MITRIGLEQLLRIWDYLAFESDAKMPAVRLVADLIFDQLRRGIILDPPAVHITPVDRSRGYAQFNDRKDTGI